MQSSESNEQIQMIGSLKTNKNDILISQLPDKKVWLEKTSLQVYLILTEAFDGCLVVCLFVFHMRFYALTFTLNEQMIDSVVVC